MKVPVGFQKWVSVVVCGSQGFFRETGPPLRPCLAKARGCENLPSVQEATTTTKRVSSALELARVGAQGTHNSQAELVLPHVKQAAPVRRPRVMMLRRPQVTVLRRPQKR